MKKIIHILSLLILTYGIYGNEKYQLLIHNFFTGEILYDIDLFNEGINKNNLYYGSIENILNIINKEIINSETINNILKDLNYPLIYIQEKKYIEYINLFPIKTIFIVFDDLIGYLKNRNNIHNIYSISIKYRDSFYPNGLNPKNHYYIKVGKKNDNILENYLYVLLVLSIVICITICFILTKILKNRREEIQMAIHFLICISSYLLLVSNFINGIFYLFFKNREYCFLMEYTTILIYIFYKSNIFSIIILVLLGWGTIFFGWGRKFKKLNKNIFFIELIISMSIPLSSYFVKFTYKLNLFYIKNLFEYLLILCINIFSIFKRIIPLANQMKYEQRMGSNIVNYIGFKYNKLFLINIIIISYTCFFIMSPFLEYIFINSYVNNYNIHFIFQLFYESIFNIFFFIIFFPQNLPEDYFNDIVFKYKSQIFLVANIYDEEINNPSINDSNDDSEKKYSNKLNISKLTFGKLKSLSKKKKKYPIIFINPFFSSRNKRIFKEMHIGIVNKNQK